MDRSFTVVYAVGAHSRSLRRAILAYKYQDQFAWAPLFAGQFGSYLRRNATWFEEFDLIVPSPAFTGAGARRPWDPVGRIAELLATSEWDVDLGAVVKRTETPAMQGLPWVERVAVASGPLREALDVPDPARVSGARVLLLDDVMTEGSTLREVARALLHAGAAEVAGLVLARRLWTDR